MRQGADFFRNPSQPAQRRYEALRAYFLEGATAELVSQRFGYSKRTLYQLAAELRAGRAAFFLSSKPGPKGPHKAGPLRERVLVLRAEDRSVTEIAETLGAEGTPLSHQTVWSILRAEGLERLPVRARQERGRPPRTEPVKAQALRTWPVGASFNSDHAGLFLLLPAIAALELDSKVAAADYPGTRDLSS